MVIPKEIISGVSTIWDDEETVDALGAAVVSSAWTLKYIFKGPASLVLTAAVNGTGWRTTLSVTDSATLIAGVYYWQAILEKGSPTVTDRIAKAQGRLTVKPALSGVTGTDFDGRTQARKDLESIQAAIRAIGAGGTKSYTIGNRSFTKMDLPDLLMLESRLKAEVVREDKASMIASGLGNPNNIYVRFNK
jgi:hypothetical protein